MKDNKPVLGITMGDVCGCGPEITVKALMKEETYRLCNPVIIGSGAMVTRAIRALDVSPVIHRIDDVHDAVFQPGTIDVYETPFDGMEGALPYGLVTVAGGESAFSAVKKAIELALDNQLDGTVTGPLHKESLNLAGHHYAGHTEIYADLTGTADYAMMLANDNLRVVHVSTHVSLREACDRVKKDRVYRVIRLADRACRDLGIDRPKIAVAGLNPHAGESGLFGTEEIQEIAPAIGMAVAYGLAAEGPVPPDTVFSKALGGMYDVVVAMYHDQGHIPLKTNGFTYHHAESRWETVDGVNITLGLPIIRVSVDHGTAFGKAGKGTASSESMESAIAYGARFAGRRIHA